MSMTPTPEAADSRAGHRRRTSGRIMLAGVVAGLTVALPVLSAGLLPAWGAAAKKEEPKPDAKPAPKAAPKADPGAVLLPPRASLFPPGGKAGSVVDAVLEGDNLADAKSVWFGHAGLKATDLAVVPAATEAGQASARLKVHVAADVPPGLYVWRVTTARGASEPRFFAVGGGDAEVVPAPGAAAAGAMPAGPAAVPLAVGAVANGRLEKYDDVDVWRVSLTAGQRVIFRVRCRALGSPAEAALAVMDAQDRLLATPKRDEFLDGDPFVDFTAAATGDHLVRVWNLTRGEDPTRVYRLEARTLPVVGFAFPAGVQRGQTGEVQLGLRDPSGKLGRRIPDTPYSLLSVPVKMPADAADPLPVKVPGFEQSAEAADVLPGSLPEVMETDAAEDPAKAQPVTVPCVVNGRLNGRGSRDHFRVTLKKGQAITAEAAGRAIGAPGDLALTILGPKGEQLAANDDASSTDPDPRLTFTAAADGDVIVRIGEVVPERIAGPDHVYRLTLRNPAPGFALSVPFEADVQAGGSAAVPVLIDRVDGFAGAVKVVVEGLPAGWKHEVAGFGAGDGGGVIVLSAPAGSAGQGAGLRIVGEATIDGRVIRSTARVAAGLPSLPDRPPSRVVPTTPFSSSVGTAAFRLAGETPKLTVAPGGAGAVKLVVERAAGLTGSIDVVVIAGPAGTVGAKGQIAAGQTKADLAIKPAAGAVSGMLLIRAEAKLGETVFLGAASVTCEIAAPAPPPADPKTAPKVEPKVEPKPAPKVDPKPAPKDEPKPAAKVEPKPAPKSDTKPAPKAEPKPAPKVDPKPAAKVEPKPAPKDEQKADPKAKA